MVNKLLWIVLAVLVCSPAIMAQDNQFEESYTVAGRTVTALSEDVKPIFLIKGAGVSDGEYRIYVAPYPQRGVPSDQLMDRMLAAFRNHEIEVQDDYEQSIPYGIWAECLCRDDTTPRIDLFAETQWVLPCAEKCGGLIGLKGVLIYFSIPPVFAGQEFAIGQEPKSLWLVE